MKTGVMGYERDYTVILLVGLTELKAQVSWIDSETVCGIFFNPHTSSHLVSICLNLGDREKVCSNTF